MKFMKNPEWLGSLKYYTKCHTTSTVECFNSHALLRYCPKRIGFTFDVYRMRNQLAVLDYDFHRKRCQRMTQDGEP